MRNGYICRTVQLEPTLTHFWGRDGEELLSQSIPNPLLWGVANIETLDEAAQLNIESIVRKSTAMQTATIGREDAKVAEESPTRKTSAAPGHSTPFFDVEWRAPNREEVLPRGPLQTAPQSSTAMRA
jgi:hypothetical protein